MTQNRLSFAGSQTLLASENEFNSTKTVGDARRLGKKYLAIKGKSRVGITVDYSKDYTLVNGV